MARKKKCIFYNLLESDSAIFTTNNSVPIGGPGKTVLSCDKEIQKGRVLLNKVKEIWVFTLMNLFSRIRF